LKALLIFNQVQFPYVHTISKLLEIIEAQGVVIPQEAMEAVILSDYAVETRYPGNYEPVGEDEYLRALDIGKFICAWVAGLIKG
jgi:HEPN domain-containing protein